MKKFLLMMTVAALFAACSNDKKEEAKTDETAKPAVALPYTAAYSSSFEMGKPEYAAMILQGSWKDWEMNTMNNMKSWVADTIVAFQSDNTMIRGVDSLQARWNRGRAGYTNVIDTVHAVMSTHSTDKNEDWVLVWAQEINTDAKGKIDTVELQETWRINKDGKADMLLQYDRHSRKQ